MTPEDLRAEERTPRGPRSFNRNRIFKFEFPIGAKQESFNRGLSCGSLALMGGAAKVATVSDFSDRGFFLLSGDKGKAHGHNAVTVATCAHERRS
jgi:hypothetical protein